jgi:hypothetical protein
LIGQFGFGEREDESSKMDRPLARSTDLIIEELGDEVLVYDTKTARGHSLSRDAARVWRHCDGTHPVEGIANQLGLDVDRVKRALVELTACDLLVAQPSLADGTTRREATIRLAKVGAGVAAAPLIVSVLAPSAAMAVSRATCLRFSSNNCGAGGGGQVGCTEIPGCCCCTAGGGCPDTTPPNTSPSCKECLPQNATCPNGTPATNCAA